jgi:hypothetical protein
VNLTAGLADQPRRLDRALHKQPWMQTNCVDLVVITHPSGEKPRRARFAAQ